MKRIFYIIVLLMLCWGVNAQHFEKITTDMQDHVSIYQDSLITALINRKISGVEGQTQQVTGYRVQIYSSNSQQVAKAEALALQQRVENEDFNVEIHVIYTPPFWKVRLGDFRTREEANLLKEEIIRRMPELQGDTYVVRDQITIKL